MTAAPPVPVEYQLIGLAEAAIFCLRSTRNKARSPGSAAKNYDAALGNQTPKQGIRGSRRSQSR